MKVSIHSKQKKSGASLVEVLAATIILSLVLVGVMQYLLVSRVNLYTSNIRTAVLQNLADTMVEYQSMTPGLTTNVPPSGDIQPFVITIGYTNSGYIQLYKSVSATNGTYTLTGSVQWRAFPNANGTEWDASENLSLQIPE